MGHGRGEDQEGQPAAVVGVLVGVRLEIIEQLSDRGEHRGVIDVLGNIA
ncbi:MAG: hypothetical protein JO181_08350 [Solirubrobacterales bacterium]|nr:hypothetical protein [Solirubrobacterales bacterium]